MDQKINDKIMRHFSITPVDVVQFFAGRTVTDAASELKALIAAGLDQLPMPGHGETLARWRILAAVAAKNLSLLKLYEGHTDALAILNEIGGFAAPKGSAWGTWCAEPPDARLFLHTEFAGPEVRLRGRKSWCSGAKHVSHALVSCWNSANEPCLAAVQLRQPGMHITCESWHAVGMAESESVDVVFEDASAVQIGGPNVYVNRHGFWYGGAGIAACWYGAASALAVTLHEQVRQQQSSATADPHRLAHLGSIDVALGAAAGLLRASAAAIDQRSTLTTMPMIMVTLRARLAVEAAATLVMNAATRALGAGPLCRDAHFARMVADLPVFLRQSHAERDLAQLGKLVVGENSPWLL